MANNNYNESWNLQGENCSLQKDSNYGGPWNEVTNHDFSCMFDERTPLKDCGDPSSYAGLNDHDRSRKSPEACGTASSMAKRRRVLQFDTQATDSPLRCEELTTGFFESNKSEDRIIEALSDVPHCVSGFPEYNSAYSCGGVSQTSEEWLEQYLADVDMHNKPDELLFPGASDVQIDISELCNDQPEYEANMVHKHGTQHSSNIIIKGRTSSLQTPTNSVLSVAYPFGFIKPSRVHGDVTLKDINQWIRPPPPPKAERCNEEPLDFYPKSAFSGKPVVCKRKIPTRGKGSITIIKTKG